jgi:P27 family predicted phage terminase small subunit
MAMGRKAIPNEIKKKRGTLQPSRLPAKASSGVAALDNLVLPEGLDPIGQGVWLRITSACDWLAESDREALTMLCKDEQMLAMLTARLEVDGVVLFTDKGYAYAHPAWGMRTATEERIYKWMSSLGLTPSDRARLGIAMVQARTLLEEFREKFAALPTGPRAG